MRDISLRRVFDYVNENFSAYLFPQNENLYDAFGGKNESLRHFTKS